MTAAAALARAHERFPATVATLARFVRFPTVSAHPARAADHDRCAAWLAGVLRGIGMMDAVVVPTAGRPAVLASWRGAPDRPTLLVYGHYDVQPAEPLSAWHLPPFGGVVHGNALFGRGASDDKGQILAHIAAIDAYLGATGRIPVNVVYLVEGEEEIGTPSLATFLDAHRDALRADGAVVSDMAIDGRRRPAITYAMRGG